MSSTSTNRHQSASPDSRFPEPHPAQQRVIDDAPFSVAHLCRSEKDGTRNRRTIDAAKWRRVYTVVCRKRESTMTSYADLMREAALRERSITWTLNRLLKEGWSGAGNPARLSLTMTANT